MFTELDVKSLDVLTKVVGRLRFQECEANEVVSIGRCLLHIADMTKRIEKSICDEKAKELMAKSEAGPIGPEPKKGKK